MEDNESKRTQKETIYLDCLTAIFDKAKKSLSKHNPNYQELSKFLEQYKDKINDDIEEDDELKADKYFSYMKMSLEGDCYKIAEVFLEKMSILIKEHLFIGDAYYSNFTSNPSSPPLRESIVGDISDSLNKQIFKLKPMLIDSVIDIITKLNESNEESLSLSAANLIQLIINNSHLGIHGDSIVKIVKFFFVMCLYSKANLRNDNIRKIFGEILKTLFKKMEETNKTLIIMKNNDDGVMIINTRTKDFEILRLSIASLDINQLSSSLSSSLLPKSSQHHNPLNNASMTTLNDINQIYHILINKIVGRECKWMVDSICLYYGKPNTNTALINPIPSSPSMLISTNDYDSLSKPKIANDKGEISGYFGWCYICQKQANYYDKDSRKPICSFKCKEDIYEEDNKLARLLQGEVTIDEDNIGLYYKSDCLAIFKSLCKMANSTMSRTDTINFKWKITSLELLYELMNQCGKFLGTLKEFKDIIKELLIENILTNCLSEDHNLFDASMNLFFKLWSYFRENLKQEIGVFNETVFLKILDSGTSSYNHKLSVLKNFENQASTPHYYIELYANYDCDLKEKFLVYRIITALGKISQGKYLKGEHSLTSQQESTLRATALKTICFLVQSLLNYTIDHMKTVDMKSYNNYIDDDEAFSDISSSELNDTIFNNNQIDFNLNYKKEIENAIEKFNIKLKRGIIYLKKIGEISKDDKDKEARDTVTFLRKYPTLKKEFIGEMLGENNEVGLKILKYYTETFDFGNKHIIIALREYLSTFLLPGEAQKIDRVLESFSNKYVADNPGTFNDPDCAYYLSFSIIILQTELHHPNVKVKMDFDAYVNFLKLHKSTEELTHEYIKDIYNQILEKPISLPEFDAAKERIEMNKEDIIKSESQRIMNECKEQLKHGKDKQYIITCDIEYVAPLMNSILSSLLAAFTVIIEETDDKNLYEPCIEGISNVIKLLSMVGLDFEKDLVIDSYCKATNLLKLKEIKDKNIKCIKEILQLGKDIIPYYKGSWQKVFVIICELDNILFISRRPKAERENYFMEVKVKRKHSLNPDRDIQIEKNKIELLSKEISAENYEQIYHRTEMFDNECVIDFIGALCEITKEELQGKERIFSLQKLTEVTELNMTRSSKVWKKIWEMTTRVFIEVSLSDKSHIAEKGIECLRQLIRNYIQKEEMSFLERKNDRNNNSIISTISVFQPELFKPFEVIIIKSDNLPKNKEHIINCLDSLIASHGNVIDSGWEIIFNILSLIAKDTNIAFVGTSFSLLKKILSTHMSKISSIIPLVTNTLISFSIAFPEEVIQWIKTIINQIKTKEILITSLSSFSLMITDKRENIRTIAMREMFNMIREISSQQPKKDKRSYNQIVLIGIDESFWNEITHKILIPLCDRLILSVESSTLKGLFILFIELMKSTPILLRNSFTVLLELIKRMCVYQDDSISTLGVNTFIDLVNQSELDTINSDSNYTSLFMGCVIQLFQSTLQKELFTLNDEFFNNKSNKIKYQEIIMRNKIYSTVQIKLLELWGRISIKYLTIITQEELSSIISCLEQSFEIAFKFNLDFELNANLMKNISWNSESSNRIVMFKQQETGINEYFKLLLHLIGEKKGEHDYENLLLTKSIMLLKAYSELMELLPNPNEDNYQVNQYAVVFNRFSYSLVENILPALGSIEYYKNETHAKEINELLIQLVLCNVDEIRLKVKEIFMILFQNNNMLNVKERKPNE